MAVAYQTRQFTVDEYHAMAAAGVFRPGERVELLDGAIVEMAPIGPLHSGIVDRIAQRLMLRFESRAIVRVQGPVRLSQRSEVQPDIALLAPRDDYYTGAHPAPADVLAIVEVAKSSLAYDAGPKRAAYARAGIADYWIANLKAATLTILREPAATGYASRTDLSEDASAAFLAFPSDALDVRLFLP
jgi:Uma2 family endonuclease